MTCLSVPQLARDSPGIFVDTLRVPAITVGMFYLGGGLSSRIGVRYGLCNIAGQSLNATQTRLFSVGRRCLQEPPKVKLEDAHPVFKKLPKSLRKYAVRFMNAPLSHVTSFIVLHELTAIVPLFGLWGAFYYYDFVPLGLPEWLVDKGTHFVDKLAERNDWRFTHSQNSAHIIMQGAAAYALVKMTLPLRAAFSLALTPWFAARVIVPLRDVFKRSARRSAKSQPVDDKIWEKELPETIARKKIVQDKGPHKGPKL